MHITLLKIRSVLVAPHSSDFMHPYPTLRKGMRKVDIENLHP